MSRKIFITGTDTDIGKTRVTGLVANYLLEKGENVITQKIMQTGCTDVSNDIRIHRKIMGLDLLVEDRQGLTCPFLSSFPSSPELSARLDGRKINMNAISRTTDMLADVFDHVIIEGIGGLYVPLTEDETLLDYLEKKQYPTILVTTPRLGSINHTLLSLEALVRRDIPVMGIVYNMISKNGGLIQDDTRSVILRYLKKMGCPEIIIDIPEETKRIRSVDFAPLL